MDPQKETTVRNAEHILLCLYKVPNQKHRYRNAQWLLQFPRMAKMLVLETAWSMDWLNCKRDWHRATKKRKSTPQLHFQK